MGRESHRSHRLHTQAGGELLFIVVNMEQELTWIVCVE